VVRPFNALRGEKRVNGIGNAILKDDINQYRLPGLRVTGYPMTVSFPRHDYEVLAIPELRGSWVGLITPAPREGVIPASERRVPHGFAGINLQLS
jgi:hypothetical protein